MRAYVMAFLAVAALPVVRAEPPRVVAVEETPPAKWTEVKGTAGRPVTLKADKAVHWFLLDETAAALVVPDKVPSESCRVIPFGVGCHKLLGFDPTDPSNPARVQVNVGDPPRPMPPQPIPPTPPADPLAAAMQAAYRTDTPTDQAERREAAKNLAAFYKVAAETSKTSDAGRLSELVKLVNDSSREMVRGQLPATRTVLREELKKQFPADVELSDEVRLKLADLFSRFEAAARTLTEAVQK